MKTFLTITRYEMSINTVGDDFSILTCIHLCLYNETQNNETQVMYEDIDTFLMKIIGKMILEIKYHGEKIIKIYSTKLVNQVIKEANSHEFLCRI